MPKIKMQEQKTDTSEIYYTSECGITIKREWETKTPNENKMNGRWVVRNKDGEMIDFDQYINDIAERHNLDLYSLKLASQS